MTTYFFPSCKVQKQFPESSQRLQRYLQERWQVTITGCCRQNHQQLQPADAAYFICNTCAHILTESSAAGKIRSVWELIDQDAAFPFPDYQNEVMTVQDCWLSSDRPEMQQAVRSLLHKMHIQPRELTDNLAKTRFCRINISTGTAQLAPRLAAKSGQMTHEERREHLQQINTDKVVCYCRPCLTEINENGLKGYHLLQLLFPETV